MQISEHVLPGWEASGFAATGPDAPSAIAPWREMDRAAAVLRADGSLSASAATEFAALAQKWKAAWPTAVQCGPWS